MSDVTDHLAPCFLLTRDLRGCAAILAATTAPGHAVTRPGRDAANEVVIDRIRWDADRLDVLLADAAARLGGSPFAPARPAPVRRWRTSGRVEAIVRRA